MIERKFIGARIEPEIYDIVNETAKEERIDKTKALKILVFSGWKNLKLKKALEKYRQGLVSIDKAAKIAGLSVNEMMQESAAHGIKSEETVEEFKEGLKALMQEK